MPRGALRHFWLIEEKSALFGDQVHLSVCLSVRSSFCDLISTTEILSGFRDIRCSSYLKEVIEEAKGRPALLKEII